MATPTRTDANASTDRPTPFAEGWRILAFLKPAPRATDSTTTSEPPALALPLTMEGLQWAHALWAATVTGDSSAEAFAATLIIRIASVPVVPSRSRSDAATRVEAFRSTGCALALALERLSVVGASTPRSGELDYYELAQSIDDAASPVLASLPPCPSSPVRLSGFLAYADRVLRALHERSGRRRRRKLSPRTERTPRQLEAMHALEQAGTYRGAGEMLGISREAARRLVERGRATDEARDAAIRSVATVPLPQDERGQLSVGKRDEHENET